MSLVIIKVGGQQLHTHAKKDGSGSFTKTEVPVTLQRLADSDLPAGIQYTLWLNASTQAKVIALAMAFIAGTVKVKGSNEFYHRDTRLGFNNDAESFEFGGVSAYNGQNKATVAQLSGSYCHQPDWSPDGLWIAFATDREGNIELFKVRRDGTQMTRLTDHAGIDCRPRWSRDGQWILFSSNRAGNFDLYAVRADGTDLRQLTTHPSPDDHADWSPDGKSIAFVSMRDGSFDIYRMPVPLDLRIGDRVVPSENPFGEMGGELVLHYNFDRESDTTNHVVDLIGRNHAHLVDAKVVHTGPQGRLTFDGVKSYATCGNGETLRIGGPLTISLWVRPTAFSGNHYLVSKHGWNLYLGSSGVPHFETRAAKDEAWDTLPGATALKAGEWSQIVAVFDPAGKKLHLYVNGKHSTEKPRLDGGIGSTVGYPLELGHYNMSKTQKYVGQMDELRILRKALSPEDVAREFERQAPLVNNAAG